MSETVNTMSKSNIYKIVIALLTTGFVGQAIGVWDIGLKREDSYIDKYVNLQSEVVILNRKNDRLENRLNTLELASAEIPFPYWIKDRNSVIIYINKEYKDKILKPLGISAYEYVNTKGEVFGEVFVKNVLLNDRKIISSKKVLSFREEVPTHGFGMSYKFPVLNNYGIVIGTAGLWIPENTKF